MGQKYRCKYEYENRFGRPKHTWLVVGAHGAIHLHITDLGDEAGEKYGNRYSGGIEIHYRTPPDYMKDKAPSHDQCWALKAPCWHDWSSMAATDHWISAWLRDPHDHDGMFRMLSGEADERFAGEKETVLAKVSKLREAP